MEPPIKPNESDCCNSGCNPCIFDVYEMQLKKYKQKINIKEMKLSNKNNCIDQLNYTIFELVNCVQHTHNTFIYTFKYKKGINLIDRFESNSMHLSYKPGQHLLLRGCHPTSMKYFTRAYTPIPLPQDTNGELTFNVMIKLYETGAMSNYLKNLCCNSETYWRGFYGDFNIDYKYKYMLCIAQGTGIAPIYSIIEEMLKNDECETFIELLFCCCSGEDILLRDELQQFNTYWNFTYKIYLSKQEKDFQVRYNEIVQDTKLNKEEVFHHLEDKQHIDSVQILICGSETFNTTMSNYFKEFDVNEEQIHLF